MATSFPGQIPIILEIMAKLQPRRVLDIGKGFGKYGFLLHEHYGIDNKKKPDPTKTLAQQSCVEIDAVECNPAYLWPHIDHIYTRVFTGRIEDLYARLPAYDLVLMLDVIEHLKPQEGRQVVDHFVAGGSRVLISTPRKFFDQDLYESADEHHRSYWEPDDFRSLHYHVEHQNAGLGRVMLVSSKPIDIRGFGRSPVKRLRRIASAILNEI